MQKKAQSAMEFLTTYGWALLVAIIVIGALVYFGVLNPSRFVSDKCEFPGGLKCNALSISRPGTVFSMSVVNLLGQRIEIVDGMVTGDRDTPSATCVVSIPVAVSIDPGSSGQVNFNTCTRDGSNAVETGNVMDLVVTLNYTIPAQGNFPGIATGYVHYRAP